MATQRIPGANPPESGTTGSRKGRSIGEAGIGASSTTGATDSVNTSLDEGIHDSGVGSSGDTFGTTGLSSTSSSGTPGASSTSYTSHERSYPRAVGGVMDKVKQQASTRVNEQKERAAQGLGSVAAAIRQASEHLRAENQTLASYTDKAVDQIQLFADRMRDKDPAEMMRDVERFARRNPTAFVGGAFLLGLGMARFLKSSSSASAISEDIRGVGNSEYGRRDFSPAIGTTGTSGTGLYNRSEDLPRSPGASIVDPGPGITS